MTVAPSPASPVPRKKRLKVGQWPEPHASVPKYWHDAWFETLAALDFAALIRENWPEGARRVRVNFDSTWNHKEQKKIPSLEIYTDIGTPGANTVDVPAPDLERALARVKVGEFQLIEFISFPQGADLSMRGRTYQEWGNLFEFCTVRDPIKAVLYPRFLAKEAREKERALKKALPAASAAAKNSRPRM